MTEARAVALSLLVLLGAFAVVAPASLALPAETSTAAVGHQSGNNSSMGGQVSSFMHASSGQASEEVQAGMWNAAYENASNRSAVVDGRVSDIASRLDALEAEKQQLLAAWENGSISQAEYEARMGAIVGRMAALNRSIDETERQASDAGANTTRVATLRTRASDMTGPEVAAMARSLAGGPPEGVAVGPGQTGPPDHAGPPDDTGPAGNETAPGQGKGNGPDGNPGQGPDGDKDGGNQGGGNQGGGNQGGKNK